MVGGGGVERGVEGGVARTQDIRFHTSLPTFCCFFTAKRPSSKPSVVYDEVDLIIIYLYLYLYPPVTGDP